MSDVEAARKQWIKERPEYVSFAELVSKRLKQMLKPGGFWFEVSARAKEVDSLVKKLLKKSHHTYETLPDKVGARVVVRFRSDIESALKLIRASMVFDKEDPKDPGIDRVGYQSVHLDGVSLPDNAEEIVKFPRDKFWVELQVRTLAQHLWSEMSHDTIYKNDETVSALPPDIRRRVNLMAGQIEVADREFDRLNQELPTDANLQLLKALERHYYTLSSRAPDPQLSLEVLPLLTPLYHSQVTEIVHRMDEFVAENRVFLEELYSQFSEIDRGATTAFLSQPELLMIYERLLNDTTAMRKAWNAVYPEKELERIAVQFGVPFS
jgi:ppGpp synthetase/RelA/SpoT-type nucleotidyltranferase